MLRLALLLGCPPTAALISAAAAPGGRSGTISSSSSWLREVPAEPAQLGADDLVLMPPSAHDLSAEVAEPVSGERGWSSLPLVLDLPGPLVHEMRAPQAEVHLRVGDEVNHTFGDVDGIAAPARDTSVIMRVHGGDDWLCAHGSSVLARLRPRKAHGAVIGTTEGLCGRSGRPQRTLPAATRVPVDRIPDPLARCRCVRRRSITGSAHSASDETACASLRSVTLMRPHASTAAASGPSTSSLVRRTRLEIGTCATATSDSASHRTGRGPTGAGRRRPIFRVDPGKQGGARL